MVQSITLADYEKAEADLRAEEARSGLVVHALMYVLVNTALIVVNLVFVSDFLWFFFPLVGWGIGLVAHYTFGFRQAARDAKVWQARVERRARDLQRPRARAS